MSPDVGMKLSLRISEISWVRLVDQDLVESQARDQGIYEDCYLFRVRDRDGSDGKIASNQAHRCKVL